MKDMEFNFSVLFLFPVCAAENNTGRKGTYYSRTLYDKENNKKARKVLEIHVVIYSQKKDKSEEIL